MTSLAAQETSSFISCERIYWLLGFLLQLIPSHWIFSSSSLFFLLGGHLPVICLLLSYSNAHSILTAQQSFSYFLWRDFFASCFRLHIVSYTIYFTAQQSSCLFLHGAIYWLPVLILKLSPSLPNIPHPLYIVKTSTGFQSLEILLWCSCYYFLVFYTQCFNIYLIISSMFRSLVCNIL